MNQNLNEPVEAAENDIIEVVAPFAQSQVLPEESSQDLHDHKYYLNRQLSHLEFNRRVLEQSLDETHPLLERLMFLLIFSSNLDEFFEIRVAELMHQLKYGREKVGDDGIHPRDLLLQIRNRCRELVDRQYKILNEVLFPALNEQNIYCLRRREWTPEQREWIKNYFSNSIQPIISPLGLDPSHPFPRLVNKSLNFIVALEGKDAFGRETGLAIIPAPRSLPRLIKLPDDLVDGDGDHMVFLSSVIHEFADELFPGMKVQGCFQFRLTRNADLVFDQEEVEDLARTLRGELHARRYGDAVRLEISHQCPEHLVNFLLQQFNLSEDQLYRIDGPVNLSRMMAIRSLVDRPDLSYSPFSPGLPKKLQNAENLFDVLKQQDFLLFHPYESFTPVIDLLRQAAQDPEVLSIRQTLYRTGADSEIVSALVEAARNGKEVTAVVELRARFDEANNLALASRLQEAGALVVYGVVGYKTHAKMTLVVRREDEGKLKHYVHLGTGNYHSGTARIYTDYSLLTSDIAIADDVQKLFQQLTGMGKIRRMKKMMSAPFTLHKGIMELIHQESRYAMEGKAARIIMKVNGLTEPRMIRTLYRASQAGVQVDLIVRGMCCLRPGIEGISENIRVRSIVGRFLEHNRTFYFANDGEPLIFNASADLMERNLLNRVETFFPVLNQKLQQWTLRDLELYLSDNTQAWELDAEGNYQRVKREEGTEPVSAQLSLLERYAV